MIQPKIVTSYTINVEELTAEQAEEKILKTLQQQPLNNHIVTLRLQGKLKNGKTSDINWKKITHYHGPYHLLINKAKLTDQEEQQIAITENLDNIEETLLQQTINKDLNKQLMNLLITEKDEGEKIHDYELRVITDFKKKLNMEELWT